jgi:transposase
MRGLHHRAGPSARRRRPQKGDTPGTNGQQDHQTDRALGRSRGGLTTKIHLACDGRGLPLSFLITGGNINDCTRLIEVIEAIRIPRARSGRPRVRPLRIIADKGYSTTKIRTYLRSRRIAHTIPERSDQLAARARRGHRRCGFDPGIYRVRNVIERCFNQLKRFRGIATRYDKLAAHYRTAVTIASLILWINQDPQNTP